jgi:Amidases related to nicotinamidase
MSRFLIVVDMQNDFVSGALGSADAQRIVPYVAEKVRNFSGTVIFTRDSHGEDYLATQEGKILPVPHCIKETAGWEIISELTEFAEKAKIFDKPAFGSLELAEYLQAQNAEETIEEIELIGVCTDICVVSNGLLIKAALPETLIKVDSKGCAGTSVENHNAALQTMRCCQVEVL